MFMSIIFYFD